MTLRQILLSAARAIGSAVVEAFEPLTRRLRRMQEALFDGWPAFTRGAEMAGWHTLTAAGTVLMAPAWILDGFRGLLPAGHATPESVAATALAADHAAQASSAQAAPATPSYALGELVRAHARALPRGVTEPELAPLPRRVGVWLDGLSPEDRSWLGAFQPAQIEKHLAATSPAGLLPGVPRLTTRRELAAHDEEVRRGMALLMGSGKLDALIAEGQGLEAPAPRVDLVAPEPDEAEAQAFRI